MSPNMSSNKKALKLCINFAWLDIVMNLKINVVYIVWIRGYLNVAERLQSGFQVVFVISFNAAFIK